MLDRDLELFDVCINQPFIAWDEKLMFIKEPM